MHGINGGTDMATDMAEDLLKGKSGEVRVLARFARRDNEESDAPEWGAPREVTLAIKRREKSLPHARWRGEFAGDVLTMNVREFAWAEYGEHHHEPGEFVNEWLCEEYRMEILEIRE
jgi:hypothetical protein